MNQIVKRIVEAFYNNEHATIIPVYTNPSTVDVPPSVIHNHSTQNEHTNTIKVPTIRLALPTPFSENTYHQKSLFVIFLNNFIIFNMLVFIFISINI